MCTEDFTMTDGEVREVENPEEKAGIPMVAGKPPSQIKHLIEDCGPCLESLYNQKKGRNGSWALEAYRIWQNDYRQSHMSALEKC